jgi:hypothetical protein
VTIGTRTKGLLGDDFAEIDLETAQMQQALGVLVFYTDFFLKHPAACFLPVPYKRPDVKYWIRAE